MKDFVKENKICLGLLLVGLVILMPGIVILNQGLAMNPQEDFFSLGTCNITKIKHVSTDGEGGKTCAPKFKVPTKHRETWPSQKLGEEQGCDKREEYEEPPENGPWNKGDRTECWAPTDAYHKLGWPNGYNCPNRPCIKLMNPKLEVKAFQLSALGPLIFGSLILFGPCLVLYCWISKCLSEKADEEVAKAKADEEAKVKAELPRYDRYGNRIKEAKAYSPVPEEENSRRTRSALTKLEVDEAAVPVVKGTVFSGRSMKVSPAFESEVELVEPEPTAAASAQALSTAAAKLVEDMKAAQPWKRRELVGPFARDEANSLAVSELPAILKLATVNTKAQILIDLIPACFRFATGDPDKTRAELEAYIKAVFEGDSFNTRKVLAELESTKPSTAEPAVVLSETMPSPTDEQVEEPPSTAQPALVVSEIVPSPTDEQVEAPALGEDAAAAEEEGEGGGA